MPLFLLRFWSQILCATIAAVLSGWFVWQIHGYLSDAAEKAHTSAMLEQKTASAAACAEATKISEELSYAYNQKISDLQRRIADIKRVQPSYVRTRDISSRTNGADGAREGGLSGSHEISTEPLYDLAGSAQATSLKVSGLQAYISSIEPFIAKCENVH